MLTITAYALSDPGKVRSENEDAYHLLPEQCLFIVSDGMGGHNAGATAAKLVVEALPQMIRERLGALSSRAGENICTVLRVTLVDFCSLVRLEGENEPKLQGMGATVVMAYLLHSQLYVANMGDSRGYLYREGKLEQLTADHSIIGIMLQDGEITPDEAKSHPARGVVSRYIGMEGLVYPDVKSVKVFKGDRLLLCSDGLTGMVSDETISEILSEVSDPQRACKVLVDAANEAGGRDNITVLLAEIS